MDMSADNFRTMVKPPTLMLVVSGPAQGTRIAVPLGGLVIGRSGSPEGRLGDDPALSRQHAVIVHSDRGELVISDLGSSNGTFLNGSRVGGSEIVRLGDIIELGNTKLQAIGPSSTGSPAAARTTPGGAHGPMTPAAPLPHPGAAPGGPPPAHPAVAQAGPAHPGIAPAPPPHPGIAVPAQVAAPPPHPHPAAPAAAAPAHAAPPYPAAAPHPTAHPGVAQAAAPHPAAAPGPAPAHPAAAQAAAPHPAAVPAQARPGAGPIGSAAGRAQGPGARQGPPAGSPPAPVPRTPPADGAAHAELADIVQAELASLARRQWHRLVSKFRTVTGYVAVALLAGLVVTVVMMTAM